jgi:hypothetical protein
VQIQIDNATWKQLEHVMAQDVEQVAFLFVTAAAPDKWVVSSHWVVERGRLIDSLNDHVELAEDVLPEVIKRAHLNGNAVVEVHNHLMPGHQTCFSRYDLIGLNELVPHVLWRLPNRPYAAIVMGPDSLDALAWNPELSPVHELVVDRLVLVPTGISYEYLKREGSA